MKYITGTLVINELRQRDLPHLGCNGVVQSNILFPFEEDVLRTYLFACSKRLQKNNCIPDS